MKKRTLKIVFAVVILFSVCSVIYAYRHPIILKWMTGSARMIGWPLRTTVYADDTIDRKIRIFHTDRYWDGGKTDCYILYLLSPYNFKTRHIISLNLQDHYAGVPSATSKYDYDLVLGILFQSETGAKFSDFRDDMKGYNFDPQMHISDRTILFRVPSKQKPEGSLIRIEYSE